MQRVVDGIIRYFPFFIGVYFLLQVGLRLLITDSAVLDESEQIMLAQYFAWGYNAQPPLYTWLQRGVFELVGVSIFGLALLKNLLLFLTYFFVYKIGKLLTNSEIKSALAALSLMLLPQIIWGAQVDQTHTVLLTSATAMTLYYYFKIATGGSGRLDFILFGIVASVGLLAKYNFVLVLIALAGTALLLPSYRQQFLQKKLIISILIGAVAVLPHFIWFLSHLDLATARTVGRMNVSQTGENWQDTLHGLKDLFVSFIAFVSPFWLLFFGFFYKKWQRDSSVGTKAIIFYMIIVFIFLFVMIAITGVTNIKERWLQPYLFLFPLVLFMQTSLEEVDKKVRIYIYMTLSIALTVALIMIARPMIIDIKGKASRANYPYQKVSQVLASVIDDKTIIYAEDKFIGGNLHLFFPETTVITPSLPLQPYTLRDEVVLVYQENEPREFLLKLQEEQFTCKESAVIKEFYIYSKKLYYSINYKICRKL